MNVKSKAKMLMVKWSLLFMVTIPCVVNGGVLPYWQEVSIMHPPFPVSECCFGDKVFYNQQVVLTLAKVCLRLVCNIGTIVEEYVGATGQTKCCEFDGVIYPSGAQLPNQCIRVFCQKGKWITDLTLEECCDHCHLFNDLHIVTFDHHRYDWYGTCNYSVTQTGFTHFPNIGVFSDFELCKGGASCLSRTTFRDNPNTVIGLDNGMVFNIMVNGELQTVPSSLPGLYHVTSSGGTHPVLVFKLGQCLYLIGSSKLTVRHCANILDVWAHPTHSGNLNGLCGHYNAYENDDFTLMNGYVEPLKNFPLAFPTSWLTSDQSDPRCYQPCHICKDVNSQAEDPCKADVALKQSYVNKCRQSLQKDTVGSLDMEFHIESCARDICLMYQNGDDDDDVSDWIRQLLEILDISTLIAKKKLGDPCATICGDTFKPVCGTDGKTYNNTCYLEKATCKNQCIELNYEGSCNSNCPIIICTLEYRPMCGTNGVTYGNPCQLAAAQCEDPCIRLDHEGECDLCPQICPENYLPVCGNGKTYYNRCELDVARCKNPCIELTNYGTCTRECPIFSCTKELVPVCGTDGKTYNNLCLLEQAQCSDPCIKLDHTGPCDQCPQICPLNYLPVCGSGKTYPNRCSLDIDNCKNSCIEYKHDGPCTRECPILSCTKELVPVCGTDGKTYDNLCLLEQAQCSDPCIKLDYTGSCEKCQRICPLFFRPVCGSGKTYSNRCELDVAICKNPCIEYKSDGPCIRECPILFCTKELLPLCGTDGKTYDNLCLMEQAQCIDPCIKLDHAGPCGRAYLDVDPRAKFEGLEGLFVDSEPRTLPTLPEEACNCILQKRPRLKQAVKDLDFLHWIMNDIYAKAALASAQHGRRNLVEKNPSSGLGNTLHLTFWSKLRGTVHVAAETINDINRILTTSRTTTADGDLTGGDAVSGASENALNGTAACTKDEVDAISRLLKHNVDELIRLRADIEASVLPKVVVKEVVENMPLAVAALIEIEGKFKDLIERLNSSC